MNIAARGHKRDAEKEGEKIFSLFSASYLSSRATMFTRVRLFRALYYTWGVGDSVLVVYVVCNQVSKLKI